MVNEKIIEKGVAPFSLSPHSIPEVNQLKYDISGGLCLFILSGFGLQKEVDWGISASSLHETT